MIKALLIDDEPLACDLVQEYLQDYGQIEVVGRCHDGFHGIKAITDLQPDLIFLDIQMPKITGFEMLELLEEPPAVIFATAFEQHAIKAFESNAVDYLLKPFSKERFDKALQKYLGMSKITNPNIQQLLEDSNRGKIHNRVVIKDGSKIRIIPVREVIRLEADDDYVRIITQQGNFVKKKTLTHFENTLPPEIFVRIHRSHLLNISHIVRIDPYEKNGHLALLKDGSKVAVSRSGYQNLKEILKL